MSITDSLYRKIKEGKEGRNIGLSTSIRALDDTIYGIQRGYIYNIFADSGAGKTTFVLYTAVYKALQESINNQNNVEILYFSFEMSKEVLFAKLLSMYLWDVKQQIITFEDILSLTDSISDEAFKYVEEAESWLKEIEKHIKIIDTPITPQQCSIVLRMWNEKFGSFEKMANNQESYTHNKGCENLFKIVITDHVKLAKDNGKGTKNTIDELCSEYIYYRNKCNITGFLIQQANRQSKSTERKLNNMGLLQLDDWEHRLQHFIIYIFSFNILLLSLYRY